MCGPISPSSLALAFFKSISPLFPTYCQVLPIPLSWMSDILLLGSVTGKLLYSTQKRKEVKGCLALKMVENVYYFFVL
jgi:hypothetical protein